MQQINCSHRRANLAPTAQAETFQEPNMHILQINSSARVEGSKSTELANDLVQRLRAKTPRDLSRTPHPALDEAALGALFTPADKRTAEQAARVAKDDALIAELQAADTVVLAVPMYNFGNPAAFKAWID